MQAGRPLVSRSTNNARTHGSAAKGQGPGAAHPPRGRRETLSAHASPSASPKRRVLSLACATWGRSTGAVAVLVQSV